MNRDESPIQYRTASPNPPVFSLIVPVTVEATDVDPAAVRPRLEALREGLEAVGRTLDERYEVLFVVDGRSEAIAQAVQGLMAYDTRIRLVMLSRPFGVEAALAAGQDHASGRAMLCFRTAEACDPSLAGELVRRWQQGGELCFAERPAGPAPTGRPLSPTRQRLVDLWAGPVRERPVAPPEPPAVLLDRRVAEALREMRARTPQAFVPVRNAGFRQEGVPWGAPATPPRRRPHTLRTSLSLGGRIDPFAAALGLAGTVLSGAAVVILLLNLLLWPLGAAGTAGAVLVLMLLLAGGLAVAVGYVAQRAAAPPPTFLPAELPSAVYIVSERYGFPEEEEEEVVDVPVARDEERNEITVWT